MCTLEKRRFSPSLLILQQFCTAIECNCSSKHVCMLQGVQCPYAHGVYERNLHPSKYRTQLCTEGNHCSRHVCFFAHSPYQLRAPTHLWTIEEAVSI